MPDDELKLALAEAAALADAGHSDAAAAAYAQLLRAHPYQLEAMLRLAGLFVAHGNLEYARAMLLEAVQRHPLRPQPAALLGTVLVDLGETVAAERAFAHAIRLEGDRRQAHRGLAVLAERDGRPEAAVAHWRLGFPDGVLTTSTYHGPGSPVRLLLISSALGGNVPLPHVLDDGTFQWTELFAESYDATIALPPDALAVNLIGDADRCARALDLAETVLSQVRGPVLNPPDRVRATTRTANAERFAHLSDIIVPRTVQLLGERLRGTGATRTLAGVGLGFPLLLRAPGFHTGQHFVRVETPADLNAALDELPGAELLAIAYVDTADAHGFYRKYRTLTIDGRLYPLHLAIARQWKVHYFSAATADEAAFRAEERAFLNDPAATLGARAFAALERAAALLGLDYGGIDFTLDGAGRLVIFEANATMVILRPADDPRFAYRRPAADAAIRAARAMLLRRARERDQKV